MAEMNGLRICAPQQKLGDFMDYEHFTLIYTTKTVQETRPRNINIDGPIVLDS